VLQPMNMQKLEAKDMPWKVTLLDEYLGMWLTRETRRFFLEDDARDFAASQLTQGGIGGVYVEHDPMED
jgi:hypothetical protein